MLWILLCGYSYSMKQLVQFEIWWGKLVLVLPSLIDFFVFSWHADFDSIPDHIIRGFHTIPNPTLLCPLFPFFSPFSVLVYCFHWIKFPSMIKTVFRNSTSLLLYIMHASFPSVLLCVVCNKVAIKAVIQKCCIYMLCKILLWR